MFGVHMETRWPTGLSSNASDSLEPRPRSTAKTRPDQDGPSVNLFPGELRRINPGLARSHRSSSPGKGSGRWRISRIVHVHDTAALLAAGMERASIRDCKRSGGVASRHALHALARHFLREPDVSQYGKGFGANTLRFAGKRGAHPRPRRQTNARRLASRPSAGRVGRWFTVVPSSGNGAVRCPLLQLK
jgi:hypothetical protein